MGIDGTSIRKIHSKRNFIKKEKNKVKLQTEDLAKQDLFSVKGNDEKGNETHTVTLNGYEVTMSKEQFEKFRAEATKITHGKTYSPQEVSIIELEGVEAKESPISKTEYKSAYKNNSKPELTKDGSIQVMNSDGTIRLVTPDALKEAAKTYAPKKGQEYEPTNGEKALNVLAAPFNALGNAYTHVLGDHDGRASLKISNNPWGLKTVGVAGEVGAVATDAVSVIAEGGEKSVGFINDALTMENAAYDEATKNALIDTGNSVTSVFGVIEGLFQAVKGGFDTGSSYLKMEDMSNQMLEKVRDKALENLAKINIDDIGYDDKSRTLLQMFKEGDTPENKSQILAFAITNGVISSEEMIELQNKNSLEDIVKVIKPKLDYNSTISDRQVDDSSAIFAIGFRLGLTPEQMAGKSNSQLREELRTQKRQKLGMYKAMTSEDLADLAVFAKKSLEDKNFKMSDLPDEQRQKFIDLGITREEVVLLAADLAKDAELKKLAALVVEQRADGIENFQSGVTKTSESVGKIADLPSNIIKVAESTDIPVIKEVSGVATGALDTATGIAGTALNGAVDLFTGNWGFDRTKKSAMKTANGAKHMVTLGHGKDVYTIDGITAKEMPNKGLQEKKSDDGSLILGFEEIESAQKDTNTGLWTIGGTLFLSDTSYKNLCKVAKKQKKAGLKEVSVASAAFLPEITKEKYIKNAKDLGNNTYKIDTGVFGSEIISAQEYQEIIDNYNNSKDDKNKIAYPAALLAFVNKNTEEKTVTAAFDSARITPSKKDKFVTDGEYTFNYYQQGSIQDIMRNEHISQEEKYALTIAQFKKEITKTSLTDEQKDAMAVILAAQIAENDGSFAKAILTGAYKCTGELNDGELGMLKRSLALVIGPVGNALQGAYQHPVTTIATIPAFLAAPGWTYGIIGGTDSAFGIKKTIIDDNFNDSVATYQTTRIFKPFWWQHGHHHKHGFCEEPKPQPPTPEDPWCIEGVFTNP